MPKAPRDKEVVATPKKRTRKAAAPTNGNGTHAANGNGAVETSVTRAPKATRETHVPNLEEQIRLRAYHLYLQRGGHGGSPEQDWLRAKEEICGQQDVA
ncbi:MAG TPA: DUF2934 domain-containing protein [Candidatus Bathyarchaeia archaeon]|nr:DUF2934 domain-containing protein [Candidatus Bathyarchaeia archaeon]